MKGWVITAIISGIFTFLVHYKSDAIVDYFIVFWWLFKFIMFITFIVSIVNIIILI
jgi:hypothetical protein